MSNVTFRRWVYNAIDVTASQSEKLSPLNRLFAALILVSVTVAVVETEDSVRALAPIWFHWAELLFFFVFGLEYVARVYAAAERAEYAGPFGRLRYVVSFWAIIDLLALLPFLLTLGEYNAFAVRILRILRLLRLAKLGRYSLAIDAILSAIGSRKYELYLSVFVAFSVMIISSSALYLFESTAQPEAFGSIPRALWWSVATLTTVGYGDVTPVTMLGRLAAGITAVTGIGMIAMPTGILASAFSDALQTIKHKGSTDTNAQHPTSESMTPQ